MRAINMTTILARAALAGIVREADIGGALRASPLRGQSEQRAFLAIKLFLGEQPAFEQAG
jgi:hypothetical protein